MAKHHCRPFQPYRLALLSSCTSLHNCSTTSLRGKLAATWNHGHPCPLWYVEDFQQQHIVQHTLRKPFEIDDADARSVQKTPAGVLFVRRGLFFVKRRRRCLAHECTSVYIRGLRVCKQTRFCMEPPTSMARSKIDLLVNFWTRVFAPQKHRCWLEPPTSLSVLKSLLPLAFLKIDGTDTRREQK